MQSLAWFRFQAWSAGLVRRPWLVTVVTVIVCAGFAAHAATSLVDARYVTVELEPRAGPVRPPLPPPGRSPPDGSQLVQRNMFCSSCLVGQPGAAAAPVSTVLTQATLIATSLGQEPYATLVVATTMVQGSWGPGEAIPGLGRVHRIAPTWIEIVDAAGQHGRLSLLDAAADRGLDPARSAGPSAAAAWSERIQRIDDQTYEVDRSLVRELVSGEIRMAGVRAVPILDHGAIAGARLLGIGATSIPAVLGLKTGDVVTTVNGAPIKSLQQLFDLYAGLDQLSSVEIAGTTRAGQPLVRTLRLR
jgi:hypothetical protein